MNLGGDGHLFFLDIVHKQVFSPLRAIFCVVTEQNVVKAQPQEFLRRQQRHAGLLRRSVTFALVAFYACGDEVLRRRFAALGTRENVV